jgi:nitrate reductase NapE component
MGGSSLKTLGGGLLVAARLCAAVDLATCKQDILSRINNNTLPRNDRIFFFNGSTHMSGPDEIWLTLEGCYNNCPKPYFDLYDDMWPRLLTWLVPALLLVGSVHLPRIGHLNRVFVILHFMGDPIDSMWALLTKAEVWNRFYALALRCTPSGPDQLPMAKALAVMLSAFEELTGDMATVEEEFNSIITENGAQLSKEDLDYILKETAEELVDSRSNEGLRTILVIVNYLWAVLAALVPEIGGTQSSQPGGRIGTAMFLSWLVTAVLLSNTLSGFTSRRTCLRIMERYTRTIKGRRRDLHIFPYSPRLLAQTTRRGKPDDFIDAQPWNGSVYSYRPCKRLTCSGGKGDWSPFFFLALSTMPILAAAVSAFVIIWFTPTIGLGCRTLWVIALTAGLFISPALTWLISRTLRGKTAWYATIAKDAVFGLSGVLVIVLSSIGIFNTCWCWSGVYSRGISGAYIDLDPQEEREYNAHHLYPAMVGACLLLQILTYLLMHRIMKPGGIVFRPREEEKMEQYRVIHGLTGSPDTEMMGKARKHGEAGGRRESEAAPLLLPPAALSPHGSPLLRPRAGSHTSVRSWGGLGDELMEWRRGHTPSPSASSRQGLLGSPPDGRRSEG